MKRYNIYAKTEKGRKIRLSWGYIELDDHGSTVKLVIRPLILSREMADRIHRRIINTLRTMGLKVERTVEKRKDNFKKIELNT